MYRMIIMHGRPRETNRQTNIMAIARRFILMNASNAKNLKSPNFRLFRFLIFTVLLNKGHIFKFEV